MKTSSMIGLVALGGGAYLLWKYYGDSISGLIETTNASNQNGTQTTSETTNASQLTNFQKVQADMLASGEDPSLSYGPDTFGYYWNKLFPNNIAPAPESMGIPRGQTYTFSQWQTAMQSKGFSGLVPSVGFGIRSLSNIALNGSELRKVRFSY